MKHIDLFSGIGGFALAAKWCWGNEYETACFCDNEPFTHKVLNKNFPNVPIIDDIRKLNRKDYDFGTIDILTGGFPCQPFSVAGKQKGDKDDRFLWPEMLRVIAEYRPTWIIGENVAGIVNMALDQVLSELESQGYATRTFIVPACAVNAPHRRDRVWIVANARCEHGTRTEKQGKYEESSRSKDATKSKRSIKCDKSGIVAESCDKRCNDGRYNRKKRHIQDEQIGDIAKDKPERNGWEFRVSENDADATDTDNGRSSEQEQSSAGYKQCDRNVANSKMLHVQGHNDRSWKGKFRREGWEQDWYEVATRFCGVDDGISNRVDRLKGLGNAIVPQVAYEIMEAIKCSQKNNL